MHETRVAAVSEPWPPCVHPDRAADRAGDADRPLEPVQSGRRGAPREDRKGQRTAGTYLGPLDLEPLEGRAEGDREAGEPGVGDEEVRALPDNEDRDVQAVEGPADGEEVLVVPGLDEEGRRPSDPIGGHRAERLGEPGAGAERPFERRQLLSRGSPAHHAGAAISSSGNEVRSPAPSVQQRSPGSSSAPTRRTSSLRPAT